MIDIISGKYQIGSSRLRFLRMKVDYSSGETYEGWLYMCLLVLWSC